MPKYRVVVERIIEEEILLEAKTEDEAVNAAMFGFDGELLSQNEWTPELVFSEKVEDYGYELTPNRRLTE